MPDVLRVALLGYGLAGAAFHAPLIRAAPGLGLAIVLARSPEGQARARREHPRIPVVASAGEVWSRASDLDLAVVATPNRTHEPLARAALDAGLAVVVDKPLAATSAAARDLTAHAARRGQMLSVFHNRRWDGDFLTVRRLIREGALGEVMRFESRFERWRPEVGDGWRERADPDDAGGVLMDLGSHLVDQALCLFGPARTVYAELDTRRPGAEVDDDAFVALTHASGTRSHLWMSLAAPQGGPRMRVLGRRAAYVKHGLDVQEAHLRAGRPAGGPGWGAEPEQHWGMLGTDGSMTPVPTRPGAYPRFYEGVVEALRHGAPPPVDPNDAVAVLEILDAARRSSEQGDTINL